ncbi:MAG TPA: hypothetical protein DE042_01380 [Colwellia sp.]|nr:hypothetical protein [Colwellia sp.]
MVSGNVTYRYGRENFCVILPDIDENVEISWVRALRKNVANQVCTHQHSKIRLNNPYQFSGKNYE